MIHFAFDRSPNDVRLMLAGREDEDFPGLEDRLDAHGNRLARNILLPKEVGCRVLAGHQIQGDQSGATLGP